MPAEIRPRPKRGFILPYAPWLRGPLAAEAQEEFAHVPAALAEVVHPEAMRAIWRDFAGTGNRWVRAWSLYSLIKWARGLDGLSRPDNGATGVCGTA